MKIGSGGIRISNKNTRVEEAFKFASNGYVDILVDTSINISHWGKTIRMWNTTTLHLLDTMPVGFWCIVRNNDGDTKTINDFGSRPFVGVGNLLESINTSAILEVNTDNADGIGEHWYAEGVLT